MSQYNLENQGFMNPYVNVPVYPSFDVSFYNQPTTGYMNPYGQSNVGFSQEEYDEKVSQDLDKKEKLVKRRLNLEQRACDADNMRFSREQREFQTDSLKINAHYRDTDYLNSLGINIGKLANSDKFVVKIKNGKPIIGSKNEIEKAISECVKKKISINDDINDINKVSNHEINLISYLIQTVKVEFRPDLINLIFTNDSGELCLNSYLPSKLMLKKYFSNNIEIFRSPIEDFLLNASKNDDDYLLNLIGSHYKRTSRRPIAIALKGDAATIKIILGLLKEFYGIDYFSEINDETFKGKSINELLEGKLIFHIDNISEELAKSEAFQDFTKTAIIDKTINNADNEKTLLFGLTIITSNSLDEIIKDCHSKVSIIEVNNIDTILSKMNLEDKGSLYDFIQNDYENFTNSLVQNDFDEKKANTVIKAKINTLEENIEEFIIDLTLNPKVLMSKLKAENLDIFEIFESGYEKHNGVKQSIILEYFHAIYGQTNFQKNADFLENLKENPNFFTTKAESKSDGKYYIYQAD